MVSLNYQIGIDVLHKKAEKAIKSLDSTVKRKFQSMTNYNKKFNIQTQLSQQLSRRLLETETMGLSKMQAFYKPILKDKKAMTKLSDAWHKSESKSLKEVTSLMGLSKTEQVRYLKRIGASADEMKRDTSYTKMNKKAKLELSKIETCRARGLNEIGKTVSKILKMEKEGLITLSSAQKKQYVDMQRMTEGYKKQYTSIGRLKAGMSGLLKGIKKAGMIFLTVLGPLFLVGAAIRTVQQVSDYLLGSFIRLEDALFELRKTAGISLKEMWKIGSELERLTAIMPLTAEELAKIAATAGRLGIRGTKNIIEFTKTVAMMATATDLTAEESAQALGKLTAAFDLPIESVKFLGSTINELSNISASSAKEIVESMKRVGATGKMIGMAVEEVAAMSATLIDMGMASERSGTRLRRLFTEMARKSHIMAEHMNKDAVEWGRQIEENPTQALIEYFKYLKDLRPLERATKAHEVFGKVGGFAATSLAQNIDIYQKHLEVANHEMLYGSSLVAEFGIAVGKTSAQLQILASQTEIARRAIGEDLIPITMKAKKAFADLLMALSGTSYGMEYLDRSTKMSSTALVSFESGMKMANREIFKGASSVDLLSNVMKTIPYLLKGPIKNYGDLQNMLQNVDEQHRGIVPTLNLVKKSLGGIEMRIDTLTKGYNDYRAGIGETITVLKNQGLFTDDLSEGQLNLKEKIKDVDEAQTHYEKTTNELSKAQKASEPNIEEIAKLDKEATDASIYLDYAIAELNKEIIDFGTNVAKTTKEQLNSNKILGDGAGVAERFLEFHKAITDEYIERTPAQKEAIENEIIIGSIVSGNTSMWKKWMSVVDKGSIEFVKSLDNDSDAIFTFRKLLENAGHTIEWIGGLPQIIPDTSIDSIKETIDANKKLIDVTETLTFSISDLIQQERERETILDSLNRLQNSLIKGGISYTSTLFNQLDTERQIDKIEETAPRRAKSEIASLKKRYKTIRDLIKANKMKEATTEMSAIADEYAAEERDLLTQADTRGTRRRLNDISVIRNYIEYQGQLIGGTMDLEGATNKGVATAITLDDIIKDLSTRSKEWDKDIQTLATDLGLPAEKVEALGSRIQELIAVPEIDKKGIEEITPMINEVLAGLGLPEIEAKDVISVLESIRETAEGLPPVQIDIGIDPDYFKTAWEHLKSEIEPLDMRVKMVPEWPTVKEILGVGGEEPPSEEFGGHIWKTGLYNLHENERVLNARETKRYETDRHSEDRSLHVSMNGITLSEGYNAKRLLEDIELYSLGKI